MNAARSLMLPGLAMLRGMAATLVAGATWLAGAGGAQAQLSPSSWPMLQHDLRHTGRSDLLGPLFLTSTPGAGAVKSLVFYDKIKMHPVVGVDGAIYVGMGWQFCAIKSHVLGGGPAAGHAHGRRWPGQCSDAGDRAGERRRSRDLL